MPHSQGLSNNSYPEPNQPNYVHFSLPWSFQIISPVPKPCVTFLNEDDFYSVRLLASCQSPKMEDHSWSAVHDCLFNIFAANLHIWRPTLPSVKRGRVMPWWQEPTDGHTLLLCNFNRLSSISNRSCQRRYNFPVFPIFFIDAALLLIVVWCYIAYCLSR